jgi:hypothetical protein
MIDSFTGDHRFLSNFHPAPLVMDGMRFATVEHAYQAAKTLSRKERRMLQLLPTPGRAKRKGYGVTLREGWEVIKVPIMADLVFQKFAAHQDLGEALLATGQQCLIEGNTWGDQYWGVCRGRGENMLGQILMHVRGLLGKCAAP